MIPESFHPAVRRWFAGAFDAPTDAQARGWAEIVAGRDTLIAAPTGSGKTLAAFLASLDRLVHRAARGEAADGIEVVYVSPLKALSSDVQKNLASPLAGIQESARALGYGLAPIGVGLRTGDTSPAARAAIVRTAPDVLVTTPESLYLMLTAERSRALLRGTRTVIVDEVHALMRDKRGSHLALSLARLDAVAQRRPQRIGLSATVHPIDLAARFLVGADRDCAVVDVGHRRDLELAIDVPSSDLQAVATNEQWSEIYDRIAAVIAAHRTTLVFVNTRKMAERVAYQLGERLGADRVAAHHGSLAKERRLRLEQRLKAGEMRAIVATASLELGIDIGAVDVVCQIGSPRAVTTLLQRIGRSGHAQGRTSRGRLFATSRDELVECAALVRAVAAGRLDRIEPPDAPLDVLAQQIVAECAAREWTCDDLFARFRTAAPYAALARADFDEVVAILADGVAARHGRAGALLHHDRVHGVLRGRRAARIVALTNGGAIPELADYRVVLDPDETLVGTVNEDWAIESMAGDVFALGSHSWRIRRVESRAGVLRVEDARGQPPSIPFWLGEAPARTWELSQEVSRLRADLVAALDAGGGQGEAGPNGGVARDATTPAWLARECGLPPPGAAQLARYVAAQRDALGVVPTMDDVVFERFFDEAGGMQLVVHAPFGGRVNRAFGLALRKRFCVAFDFELQAAATEDAIVLSMGSSYSFPLTDALHFVRSDQLDRTLEQAVLRAPMFATRWRWNASRALAVLRRHGGKKVPPFLQRMRAEDLLAAVFPAQVACQENATGPIEVPDHPLVRQTMRDCLTEAMDRARLGDVLERFERGEVRLHARDTTEPSPFAHETLNARPYAFLDDAPLEERRTRAVSLRRTLPEEQRDLGALDPAAIARVVAEARGRPRDADELHDALLGGVLVPIDPEWGPRLQELERRGRAATRSGFAFAIENAATVAVLHPGGRAPAIPAHLDGPAPPRDVAVLAVVRGHAEIEGPFTIAALARKLALDEGDVAVAVARLEADGLLLRGRFRDSPGRADEYCDRRLLARIHRQTLDGLRREIEPVSAQDFVRYLFERHHLTARARAGGVAGLKDAIAMLQGFEIAAAAWERDVLAPRVAGYRPEWLDRECLAGLVAWARLSPRRVGGAPGGSTSRATPIAIVLRRDLGWLLEAVRGSGPSAAAGIVAVVATDGSPSSTSDAAGDARAGAGFPGGATADVLGALRRRGALFFDDLAAASHLTPAELTDALWELVGRGLVSSDGLQPLRDLLSSGRALRARRRRRAVQGRWSLVEPSAEPLDRDELADRVAGQLLARYGVVFREIAARESFTVAWRDVLRALRVREARGLVRGGRFVSGFLGEQYAAPDAVEALRRVRRTERTGEIVHVRASDPLNVVGVLVPGPRIPSSHGGWVTFLDGAWVEDPRRAPVGRAPRGSPRDPPPVADLSVPGV